MRLVTIAVAAALAFASAAPAVADELSDAKAFIEAAGLSDKADLLLWCGAAFTISSSMTDDAAMKKQADDLANTLFNKATVLIQAEGVKDEDLKTFGTDYALVAKSELVDKLADPEHTQEECTTAASEA